MELNKEMKDTLKVGIEIECIVNSQIHNIQLQPYHSEWKSIKGLLGWKAETDGSLRTHNEFEEWSTTAELISRIYSIKGLESAVKRFIKYFSKNNKYELNEVLSFNDTCGSHIHFSIIDFYFGDKVIYEIYPKIRKFFIKKIENSNIQSKDDIIRRYNRFYAKKLTKGVWNKYRRRRRNLEFNFSSEYEDKGLEWRSLNLTNIRTWKEFEEFFDIIIDTLKYIHKLVLNYSIKTRKSLKLELDNSPKQEFIEIQEKYPKTETIEIQSSKLNNGEQ